jgi:ferredoxin-type protein NapG
MSGERLDRRNFFRHGLRNFARTVADSVSGEKRARRQSPATPIESRPFRRLRPPGALPEEDFLSACTRCDACFDACPVDAIVPVPDGRVDAGTPRILAAEAACAVCSDFRCSTVCEPGALLPIHALSEIEMGLARVDPQHCVTFHGQACDACVTACPTQPPAVNLVDGHPSVDVRTCIGCGLCEQLCPVAPKAIQVENPIREGYLAAMQHEPAPEAAAERVPEAKLESEATQTDAGQVAESIPPPKPERPTTRRVEPIPEHVDEAKLAPSTVPQPRAAWLLISAPIFATIGLMGWLLLILGAPVLPAPDFRPLALLGDFALCLVFILPHSMFARGQGRRWLNMPFGPCGERPLYVFMTGVSLIVLTWGWRTSGPVLWAAEGMAAMLMRAVQVAGLVLAVWAAFVVGAASMLGLPQLRALAGGRKDPSAELIALPPYSLIRQPLNLGILMALLAMPEVTLDRLLLGIVFAIWILLVAPFEERDAEMEFGEGYTVYRDRIPRWMPRRRTPSE